MGGVVGFLGSGCLGKGSRVGTKGGSDARRGHREEGHFSELRGAVILPRGLRSQALEYSKSTIRI